MAKFLVNPITGNLDLSLNKATEIKYSNSTSGLTATNVQLAIDEVQANIDAIPAPIYFAGTWDASTNTPTLANTDVGMEGALYRVNVAGTVDFGAGPITFAVGDNVVNNGTVWLKWDHSDQVESVNGQTGAVVLTATDVGLGNVDNTSDATKNSAVATLTNKSIDADQNTITNIENADIKNGAAIALAKLAATTADRALVSDGSGFISPSSTTATEVGYLSGVTSAIQTQLNSKIGYSISSQNANFSASAGITYLVDTSGGAINATLPTATANTFVIIKDTGSASTNAITLIGTVDGQVNPTITSDYGSVTLVANGTAWFAI